MIETLLPVLICTLWWWLGTGIILRLDSMPEHTYRNSMLIYSVLVVVTIAALFSIRESTTVSATYLGFAAAIIIWGWLEFLHYSGYLVGPRVADCPSGVSTFKRFNFALHAMLYRELSVALVGLGLFWLCVNSPNKTVLYTYLVLWVMRVSAELNLFFGVAFLPEEWLPKKLQYLMTYRKARKINALFPLSVGLASVVCFWLFVYAPTKSVDAFGYTTNLLLGTLLLLAIIEHGLMVLPVKGASLWSWALSRPDTRKKMIAHSIE